MRKATVLLLLIMLYTNPLTILSGGVLWIKEKVAIPIVYLKNHVILYDINSNNAPFSLINSSDGQAVESYDKAEINTVTFDKRFKICKDYILMSEPNAESLSCYDVLSGRKLWTNFELSTSRMDRLSEKSIYIDSNGNIYISQYSNTNKYCLYVVNSTTGKTLSRLDSPYSSDINVLYANDTCILLKDNRYNLHFFNIKNQKDVWKYTKNNTWKVELFKDLLVCFGQTIKEDTIFPFDVIWTIYILDTNTGKEIIKPMSCANYVRLDNKLFVVQNIDNEGKKLDPIIYCLDLDTNKIVKSLHYNSDLAYPLIQKYDNSIILLSYKQGISYIYIYNDNLEQIKETLTINKGFSNAGMCENYLILTEPMKSGSCNLLGLKIIEKSNRANYIKYIMYMLFLMFKKINP